MDIALTQQQQIGQMYGWLATWGLPQSSPSAAMTWISTHGTGSGEETGDQMGMTGDTAKHLSAGPDHPAGAAMPGMASLEDLARLDQLTGRDAEVLYLQHMIPHHRGGIAMAQVAAERATQPQVRRLAQAIVDSQAAELTVLQQMLDARGGPLEAS